MAFALRTLEYDRIVDLLAGLALTPMGAEALAALEPQTGREEVAGRLAATTETVTYFERHALFPLRAANGLQEALALLDVEAQPLDPLPLRMVADFVDSVAQAQAAVRHARGTFPVLSSLVARAASFTREIAAVRHAIDASGEVLDHASPALRSIREGLRQKRQRLRGTLEQFVRGRETAKYLQDQVITERSGRYVLVVRAEHRGHVPGIVHGSSASGASLFLEPAATVEINNDIVELEERERDEVRRVLLELTDAFRARPDELAASLDVAVELDVLQAKARLAAIVNGVAPELTDDGSLELRAARHPLLIAAVRQRLATPEAPAAGPTPSPDVVPVDIRIDPPARVLLISGPNTGGKTVAIKTAGLLALMAQSGLHVPAVSARLPVFRTVFADIGDEQSIASSLSTFSAHITNIVAMDRQLEPPSLVLLDEVGTGTDPNEGGALATAIVHHFLQRGAFVIATTHFDAVKSWAASVDGVVMAAFAFDARTYAPTYQLVYGAPGRSLAIEMAQRLGMPMTLLAEARGLLSDDQKRLAAHLARVDAQARALEADRRRAARDRRALGEAQAALAERERTVAEREQRFARRLNDKLDDRVRQARRDIDQVIDQLKERSEAIIAQVSTRARGSGLSTGELGAARADARAAIEGIVERLRDAAEAPATPAVPDVEATGSAGGPPVVGARVAVGALGMEGTLVAIHGRQAEIDVRGKRLRTPVTELRVVGQPVAPGGRAQPARVRVTVDLRPREGVLGELNVIGCSVDDAIDRVARFLDQTLVTDLREVRIVHGHGTGQLRRGLAAYLKDHPLVAHIRTAPPEQGGGGATIVELKE